MSKSEGKGSILLKLLILILIVALIFVIQIPGNIWEQERSEIETARYNMMSIYESELFYKKSSGKFTTDPAELITAVRQDSSILQQQQIVNYTKQLNSLIAGYLKNSLISALVKIDANAQNIVEDLNSNRRNFKAFEDINNEAEDLRINIVEIGNETDNPNFVYTARYLDSLRILQRDLTNFTLQVAAGNAAAITDSIGSTAGQINLNSLKNNWSPLSSRFDEFVKTVNRSELVNITSVGDRVKDFKGKIDEGFATLSTINLDSELDAANQISAEINQLHNSFLGDFIVTSKAGLLRLSESDSLILHLTEDNFYSPINGEMYIIQIAPDSNSIRVESPVLLAELKGKAQPILDGINELPILPAIQAYTDTLRLIQAKGFAIRKALRRNTDIFINYKELEELIFRSLEISMFEAFISVRDFKSHIPETQSYSDIEEQTTETLTGIRIFRQAYEKEFYGNLDSLHRDIKLNLEQFNELLASVRRLPKDVVNFEQDILNLDVQMQGIKSISSPQLVEKLTVLEKQLEDYYLNVEEGSEETISGVFSKKIINPGYIYKNIKSWEESN